MPSSSLISLRLITRFGVTTSSFIRASRSLPPASISAGPQVLSKRATACSLVVGLAYSKLRIAPSFLLQGSQDAIGRHRQLRHTHANSVGDSVGNRCARRDRRWLAKPDRPT